MTAAAKDVHQLRSVCRCQRKLRQHPNVVRLHEFEQVRQQGDVVHCYFLMDLCKGQSTHCSQSAGRFTRMSTALNAVACTFTSWLHYNTVAALHAVACTTMPWLQVAP